MDNSADQKIFENIAAALEYARKEHPIFGSNEQAFAVVKSEMLEWESQAIMVQAGVMSKWHRMEEEAYQVIAVLIRYLRGI
jgi:hypothetical protein